MSLLKSSIMAAASLLVSFSGAPCRAKAPPPRHGEKLIIINDDGFSPFFTGQYKSAEDLRKKMLGLRDTQVAVMEWCITSGSRVNYPSKAADLIGEGMTDFPRRGDRQAAESLKQLVAEGVDTLKVVTDACHGAGMQCYASMRMNGDYPESYMDGGIAHLLNSSFWWKHPEFRVRGPKGEDKVHLSYAFPEVRGFKMGILREAVERDINGLDFDFLRHPPFFGYEEPLVRAFEEKYGQDPRTLSVDEPRWLKLRGEIMTGFLRDKRKLLDEASQRKGRHLGLAARIDWREHRAVETWLKEGLLDYLVVAQHTLGGYEFDIAPFVAMAKGSGCAVLFGEEAATSGHDLTAEEDKLIAAGKMKPPTRGILTMEQYRARAARWYAAGADGIHLFNETRREPMSVLGTTPPAGAKSPQDSESK